LIGPVLKVPKCEIFHHSDFHYFYTIKPFCVDDFVVKILLYYFNFGGARPHLVSDAQAEHTRKELMRTISMHISSLRARAQCTHQFLTRMLSMV
jgi:hypothetical protein